MSGDQAFVVMQVGAKDSPERKRADETYDFIVKPALAQFGIKAYRADLDPSPGGITSKMLTELLEAKLVIADLSGRNPNVFYELGIAHSFARPVITIVDTIDALPFDTKDQRVIELGTYRDSGLTYAQGETAKKALIASLEVVFEEGYDPPSPVRDVAGSQSLDALAPENPVASELSQMRETIDEIRSIVTPRIRSIAPASMRADVAVMREAIEQMIAAGADLDLIDLITPATSGSHDEWVRQLMAKQEASLPSSQTANAGHWAFVQEPATRDPWETTSDDREDVPF
jgi:hypothetical protein